MQYYNFVYQNPKNPKEYITIFGKYCTLPQAQHCAKELNTAYNRKAYQIPEAVDKIYYISTKHR